MSRATLSATPYSGTFTPTSIAGCQLWLDGADATTITLSGSTVTQWTDKSGSGNNATPFYTGPTLAQNVINSLPGLSFSGTNIMKCGAFLTSTSFSAFIVVNNNSGTKVSMGVWRVQYGSYIITDAEIKVGTENSSAYNASFISIPNFTTTHMYAVTLSSSSAPGSSFTYNGSYDGLNTVITGTSSSGNAATCAQEVAIGGLMENNSPQYMMTGYIHEVIFFSNALTSTQRQQVEGYLAAKWGLQSSLPAGHPHVSSAPTIPNALGITRPALSLALAPTPVRALGTASYSVAFTPTSIAGCQLWLDAADATTFTISSGSNVSTWSDKSGNNRHISQATTGNQPSYANNTVTFNGSQYLTNAISCGISGNIFTVYIIYKPTSTSGNQRALFIIDGSSWIMIDNNQVAENTNGIGAYIGTTISTTTPTIVAVTSATTYSLNGNAFSNISTAYNQAESPTSINLGSGKSGGVPFNGSIYEVLVYNSVLSLPQYYQVTGYLAWKWGVQASLPQSLAPALTNPTSISGCILWLDATDPVGTGTPPANGSTLTTWKDKSVSNFPFTSVGSAYNTTAVNSLPGINISTNFFGYDPGSSQNNWQEIFVVGLWTGDSTFNSYNGLVTGSIDSGTDGIILIGNAGSTSWYGSGNGYQTPFLNGTQTGVALPAISTPFIIRTFTGSAVSIRGLRFGIDRSWTDRKWVGFISEVICYNTTLTASQRLQVEGYLAWKWGTQANLVNTHPNYSSSPAHSYAAAAPIGANLRPAISQALVPAGVRGLAATRKLQSYTQAFSYTGANQTFVVPSTVTSLTVYMWGAGGGGGHTGTQGATAGGAGAYLEGTLTVTPNNSLTIIVGGGGAHGSVGVAYGGGGSAAGAAYGGGGGRSAIQLSGTELVDAGGGGGAGYDCSGGYANFSPTINGGAGYPGLTGASWPFDSGGGGTQTAGGAAGPGNASSYGTPQPGTYLAGGLAAAYAGAGGSGYYGGGGGNTNDTNGAGGGGGSSYTTNAAFTLITGSNSPNSGYSAPASASPYYVSGVAAGSTNMTTGGNGRIVLVYLA